MRHLCLTFLLFLALTLPGWSQGRDVVNVTAWSPDGKVIASGHLSGRVILRDGITGETLREVYRFKEAAVDGLAFQSPSTLVAWTFDGQVAVIGATLGAEAQRWNDKSPIQNPVLGRDRSRLAWVSVDQVFSKSLSADARPVKMDIQADPGSLLAFSHDGRYLAVSRGPNVVCFDTDTGQRVGKLKKDGVFRVAGLAFTPAGTLRTLDNISVREWSIPQGQPLKELVKDVYFTSAKSLVGSPDGTVWAAGGILMGDWETRFWPNPTDNPLPIKLAGRPLHVLDDGRLITLKLGSTATVEVRDHTGALLSTQSIAIPEDQVGGIPQTALSPDGRFMTLPLGNKITILAIAP